MNKTIFICVALVLAFAFFAIVAVKVDEKFNVMPIPIPREAKIPIPREAQIPLSREAQIKVYKDKQTSLAIQFDNSKKAYYSAGLSVSQTDDFSEKLNRMRVRDSYVVNMRKIKTEYSSLEKEVVAFYKGTLPKWWHDNLKKDSDKWYFVFKLDAL